MPKRIIVAYDGSDLAREAFEFSVTLAEATGASIMGLHVLEPVPPPVVAESIAGIDATPTLPEFDAAARRNEDAERARFEREFGVQAKASAAKGVPYQSGVEVGLLIPALVDLAGAEDLIAIGMKGRFARAGLGSSAKSLIKKAPCPVLVASGPSRPIRRVLAVFDGSAVSKRAVARGRRIAEASGWPLTVLVAAYADATLDEAIDKAQELAPNAAVVSTGVKGESKAAQIEEAAEHADDALVVMGAYPDSWLHQLFFSFGGTTANVLARVDAPVLMVH